MNLNSQLMTVKQKEVKLMSDLQKLLKGLTPKASRSRTVMPLKEWVDEFLTKGIKIIDCFVSTKKENPKGYHANKIRLALLNGDNHISKELKKTIEETTAISYYAIATNAKKQPVFILINVDNVEEMEKMGYDIYPMIRPRRVSKSKVVKRETDDPKPSKTTEEVETDAKASKKTNKGKKSEPSKK